MSEKSFAIASISAAFIVGTFFYPPPPAGAQHGQMRTGNLATDVLPAAATATARPAVRSNDQMAWLRVWEAGKQPDATPLRHVASPAALGWSNRLAGNK